MDIKVAEALSLLMMRINSQLDDSVALVIDKCSPEDLEWYCGAAGNVMGAVFLDIEQRLWSEHPGLKPREMDGSYIVDPVVFEPRFYPHRPDVAKEGRP